MDTFDNIQRQLAEISILAYGPNNEGSLLFKKNLGTIYLLRGLYDEAEILLEEVTHVLTELFGDKDKKTLNSMSSLAQVLLLQEQVLTTRQAVLGEKDPDTLRALFALAKVYKLQEYELESRRMLEEVFELRMEALGPDSPGTLESRTIEVDKKLEAKQFTQAVREIR
ncbi:hypothetical protein MMC27_007172 [Xylographa pallens]|nr:hypothetical protein [Xylographa pallens]